MVERMIDAFWAFVLSSAFHGEYEVDTSDVAVGRSCLAWIVGGYARRLKPVVIFPAVYDSHTLFRA